MNKKSLFLFVIILVTQINPTFAKKDNKLLSIGKKSYLGFHLDQFYHHKVSKHSKRDHIFNKERIYKEHGYTGFIALEGKLIPTKPQQLFSFYTGITSGIGFANYKDIYEQYDYIQINKFDGHPNFFFTGEYEAGLLIQLQRNTFSFSSGVAYEFNKTSNDFEGAITHYQDYQYNLFDIPFAIQWDCTIGNRLILGVSFINRFMVYGNTGSYINFEQPLNSDGLTKIELPKTDLTNKYGLSVELPIQIALNKVIKVKFTPWFKYRPFNEIDHFVTLGHLGTYEISRYGFLYRKSYQTGMVLSTLFCKR